MTHDVRGNSLLNTIACSLSVSVENKFFLEALERNKLLNSSEVRSYCMMFWGIQVVAVIYDGSNVGHYLDINYSVLAKILRHFFNVWLNYNTFSLWFILKRLAKDSEVLFSINPSGMFRSACRYTKGQAAIFFRVRWRRRLKYIVIYLFYLTIHLFVILLLIFSETAISKLRLINARAQFAKMTDAVIVIF